MVARSHGVRRALLAAAIMAACVDGPTAPGLFGGLHVQPAFAPEQRPATLGVAVESAAVRVTRPSDPVAPIVDSTVAYATDTSSFAWILELRSEAESLDVDVDLRGGGQRLYSGHTVVEVRDDPAASPPAAPVAVAYVGPPIVVAVTISPAAETLESLGATVSLTAEARDRNGVVVPGAVFTWASDDEAIASVDPAIGVVTAVAGGTATITATSGGAAGSARITVNPIADVASLEVSPAIDTLRAVGATRQFTARAKDAAGNVLAGVLFSWGSGAPGVATVDPASGLATAVAHGTTRVTAAAGSATGSATLAVDLSAEVAGVEVTPGSASLTAVGATQQFSAVARDAGGAVVPVAQFAWTTSAPSVAAIDTTTGLATAVGHGTTMIRAAVGSVLGEAALTVDLTASVASVTVTPAGVTLTAVGATQQFSALARDAGGAVVPGVPFTWSSGTPDVATVDAASGLASAVAQGTAAIRASAGSVFGEAALTVDLTAAVARITVTPEGATVTTLGATQQYSAEAFDATGALLPGVPFVWRSSDPAVGTIDATTGLATATGNGLAGITATAGGQKGDASFRVELSAAVASITVTPASATLTSVGATRQFTAVAHDAAGTILPGIVFAWTSSDPAVASVGLTSGLATATGQGATTIRAALGSVFGEATLTVDLTTSVASVTITPAAATLTSVAATQQFTAVARDAAGTILPGISFSWTSADTAVATIDTATGLATARAHGTTAISATVLGGSRSGQARLTVDLSASIARVEVIPESATLTALGATQQYTAVARDASGGTVPVAHLTWASSDPAVGVVDSTGLATATGGGVTTITAAAGGHQNSGSLHVDLSAAVASIAVTPVTATLTAVGATQPFTAVARDAGGTLLPGVAFSWGSSDTAVAGVGATTGVATAKAHGSTTISATAGTVSGQATLTVDLSAIIASIEVIPEGATLTALGATQQFTAVARDRNRVAVPVAQFAWASADTTVGIIDPASGLATARGNGLTSITATAGGRQGSGSLRVDLSAAVTSITVTPASATLTAAGATQQFTAVARDAAGTILSGIVFTWSSSATAVATVGSTTGLATAAGEGTTTITATSGSVSGQAALKVGSDDGTAPTP